ncbi:MAG: TonB-dependent receptor [Novosphingobium sp.]|nr:TonB-dependent receptor [Novosphingobium sp.]
MARKNSARLVPAVALGAIVLAHPAHAQIAKDDVLAESDDAFGTTVGLESTGIYTDRDTRGFSPLDAGNVRIDGIYFDQASFLTNKLRQTTAIRVGFGAVETPFVAPTGVVDHRLRPFPKDMGGSLSYTRYYYGGAFYEGEFRVPVVKDRIAISGGYGYSEFGQSDGAQSVSWGVTLKANIRVGRFELAPFYGGGKFTRNDAKVIALVSDGYLPEVTPTNKYLGQDWARGAHDHGNYGATLKGSITDHLYFRGGLFHSLANKKKSFSEIYRIQADDGRSLHYVLADPPQQVNSTSGEGLFVLHYRNDRTQHRFYAGYRARDRVTETDGSDFINLGSAIFGQYDRIAKPDFQFTEVNRGRVKQSSWLLGYVGFLKDVGQINIGLQKARYRATITYGETGEVGAERADPWLYNAALRLNVAPHLIAYAATQRGLEDSGLAPESAINRNEQLPAARSTQYEGGLRYDFGKAQLVLAAFQITKPNFGYDADRRFVVLADQRHRGVEFSLAGHFDKRFDILVGGYLMDPSVNGPGRDAGLVGPRPTGVPKFYGRLDASWHTGLPGATTFTASVEHLGARPATATEFAHLGGKQLMLPSVTTLDLGSRHVIPVGPTTLGVRMLVRNLFDAKAWHVPSPDVLFTRHRRSLLIVASLDF